jgi:hypothetical protein
MAGHYLFMANIENKCAMHVCSFSGCLSVAADINHNIKISAWVLLILTTMALAVPSCNKRHTEYENQKDNMESPAAYSSLLHPAEKCQSAGCISKLPGVLR